MAYLYIGNQKVTPILAGGENYRFITFLETNINITLLTYTIYTAINPLNSLNITLPENIDEDFIAQINFKTGETPTDILPNEIEWFGDNVNELLGFKPRANCEYSVIFYYTGTKIRGVIQGSNIEL